MLILELKNYNYVDPLLRENLDCSHALKVKVKIITESTGIKILVNYWV